jgi:hypothetical protein
MPQHITSSLGHSHSPLIPSVSFDTPAFSHDAGVLLLQQVDDSLDFSRRFAECLNDSRDLRYVRHSRLEQVRQCLFQLALGYPDRNDAAFLRHDPLFKFACQLPPFAPSALSSQPTLSRLENDIDMYSICRLLKFFESSYIQSLPPDTSSVVIDIDPTSSPVHGNQELTSYNAFYRCDMYHPLLLFDGQSNQLITALLRPGKVHAARGALPILSRVIRGIKKRFPHCRIVVRADAGFSVPRLYEGLEKLNSELGQIEQATIEPGSIEYEIGIARNQVLLRLSQSSREKNKQDYEKNHEYIREFSDLNYAAATWLKERRIIIKDEYNSKGGNLRFLVVSDKKSTPEALYAHYCGRGQCENGIKDCKNALNGSRLSCSKFKANAFRLLLTAAAYRLLHAVRQFIKESSQEKLPAQATPIESEREREPKQETVESKQKKQLAKAQFDTLRQRLLKVTAWVRQEEMILKIQLGKEEAGAKFLVELLETLKRNTS